MRMSPLYLRFFVLKRPTFSAVLCILVGGCTFTACSSRPKPIYIDTSAPTDGASTSNTSSSDESDSAFRDKASPGDTTPSSGSIEIPYREQGGVKYVKVEVNGMGVEMIFDTGASNTLISMAEARYLYEKGQLTADDILGKSSSRVASGDIVQNTVVRLREVVIGGRLRCENVIATVSDNVGAPLLLGNEVLNRAAAFTIDNERKVVRFMLRS